MLSWLLATALASDTRIEEARHHLEQGRPVAAFELTRAATVDSFDPELWLTHFEACEAIGLGVACRAELSLLDDQEVDTVRQWFDRLHHGLEVDLAGGPLQEAASGRLTGTEIPIAMEEHLAALALKDPDAAVEASLLWLDAHPSEPDVVAPVLGPNVPPRTSIGKLRKSLAKRSKKALKDADTVLALRWLRLARHAHLTDAHAAWSQWLSDQGVSLPVEAPLERADLVKAADALALADRPEIPYTLRANREGVALRAAQTARSAGRNDHARAVLETTFEATPTLNLALGLVEHLLTTHDPEAALAIADDAVVLAVSSWPTDTAIADRTTRRDALAKAMAARGAALLALERPEEAVVDLMMANQIAIEAERAGDLEKSMKRARYALETLKASLDTARKAGWSIALDDARKALEDGRPADASAKATQALQVLSLPTHRRARLTATLPARPEIASAFAVRARARVQLEQPDLAAVDLQMAVLLEPFAAPTDWWSQLADLREGDAGLLARAMAHHGEEEATAPALALSGRAPTPATGEAVFAALASRWLQGRPEEPTPSAVSRGRVIPYTVRSRGSGGGGGSTRPVLNEPFPRFAVETDAGTMSLQKGRIYLVTFIRTDSPSSKRALTDFTVLARKMRGRGLDVAVVAVRVDEREDAAADLTPGERQLWGPLAWAPDLGERFGVLAVPTTWIVDSSGIARFVHVGYLGPSEYEAEIRYVSAR